MKHKILIVEDDCHMRRLLEYNLGKDFAVATSSDGAKALAWLQAGNLPDLIVADVRMPNVHGFDFLKNIRVSGRFKNIPVIFLTAKAQSSDRIAGLKLGADDYMTKPFNPEELAVRIEKILHRNQV